MRISVECLNHNHLDRYAQAKASCVIVSLPHVSLRASELLDENSLIETIQKAHALGMQVALNMMSFVDEEEIEYFEKALMLCKEHEVDFIYFSDMGVFEIARELGLENRLIYQPNTLITSSDDAQCYLDLGLKSVVLSREITFEDVLSIIKKVSSCEVVVFGYNVMMHSRRKLLSSYFEFIQKEDRSSSKDLFLMEENREEKMPIFQDEKGTHVLSGHVFCFYKELDRLNCDIKIEGYGLKEEVVLEALKDVVSINEGNDGCALYEQRKLDWNLSDGFMYKKTSLVKED